MSLSLCQMLSGCLGVEVPPQLSGCSQNTWHWDIYLHFLGCQNLEVGLLKAQYTCCWLLHYQTPVFAKAEFPGEGGCVFAVTCLQQLLQGNLG